MVVGCASYADSQNTRPSIASRDSLDGMWPQRAWLVQWKTFPSSLSCSMDSDSFATKVCIDGDRPRRRTFARTGSNTSIRLSHDE
jgi:hypothetical protein